MRTSVSIPWSAPLPAAGKRICFILSYSLMLYADWLLLSGSWRQTLITAGDRAPATNLSVGLFYSAGIVFGISAGVILIYDLVRVLRGAAAKRISSRCGNPRNCKA